MKITQMKKNVDIVIISDVHLGTYGCHAKELLNYLRSIKPDILIINGDFIDMWQFNKKYFPKEHLQVIHKILKMSLHGTKVYYLTGNHDDLLRRFSDFSSASFNLRDKLVLQIKDRKYWIFHGDVFDNSIQYSKMIAKMGSVGYNWLIYFNRSVNLVRTKLGLSRMSFSQKIKMRVKEAVKFISDFEETAIQLAAEQGYDFVICGHIHRASIREVETSHGTVTYLNSGDWVESLTALEYNFGKWTIYQYDELDYQVTNPKLKVKEKEKETQHEEEEFANTLEQSLFLQKFYANPQVVNK